MKTLFCCLITSIVLFASCEDPIQVDEIPTFNKLIGSWRWVRSEGGMSGNHLVTPKPGEEVKLTFSRDSVYYIFKNGDLKENGKFFFRKDVVNHWEQDSLWYIQLKREDIIDPWEMPIEHEVFKLTATTLLLHDAYPDSYKVTYDKLP